MGGGGAVRRLSACYALPWLRANVCRMPVTDLSSYEEIAQSFAELARSVGQRVLALQGEAQVAEKAPGELVCEADQLAHRLIRAELADRYPGVPLVMEAPDNAAQVPARCIAVDELDGTHVFCRGGREYGISLAFIEAGRPIVGVMHQPAERQTAVALRGQGTFLDDERISLAQTSRLASELVMFEINRHLPERGRAQLHTLAERCLGIRCVGSAVGSAMDLLRGRVGVYINWRGARVWDFAAAALAVEEAGGVAISCRGHALTWDQLHMSVMLAANARLASEAFSCNDKAFSRAR